MTGGGGLVAAAPVTSAYASHRAAKTSSASHVNFDSFVFYVSISIQNIVKRNLQRKFEGASVWPKSTAIITGVMFTCPGRAGPGRFLGLIAASRI